MAATIEDVARRAKVSVATVSRALRGLPNVAPSTRERVMQAATDLHYVADPSASRLAGGRSQAVGLVVPALGQWFYGQLFSGVEAVVTSAGYELVPFTLLGPGGVDRFLRHLPFRRRVDGLVVADVELSTDRFERITAAGVPVVTLGIRADGALSLGVDHVAAARLALGHLTGLGHRRVALICGAADDPQRFTAPLDRVRGYREALRAAGGDLEDGLVVTADVSLEGGAEAMHRLLTLDHPPTAVFAATDEVAIGAVQVARDAGLRVPEDLSVVGFDDHDVAAYVGLTTIRQDVTGQGRRVATRLLDVLTGQRHEAGHDVHPTRLVVRRTTGPPPPGLGYRW